MKLFYLIALLAIITPSFACICSICNGGEHNWQYTEGYVYRYIYEPNPQINNQCNDQTDLPSKETPCAISRTITKGTSDSKKWTLTIGWEGSSFGLSGDWQNEYSDTSSCLDETAPKAVGPCDCCCQKCGKYFHEKERTRICQCAWFCGFFDTCACSVTEDGECDEFLYLKSTDPCPGEDANSCCTYNGRTCPKPGCGGE